MRSTRQQVKDLLSAFKEAAQRELHVIPRDKNLAFLLLHGFTPQERKEVLLGLQVEDYWKGPEEDDKVRGGPRDIWFFGVDYQEIQIYIKLQLVEEKDAKSGQTRRHAKCISFHEAEWPIVYPYKG